MNYGNFTSIPGFEDYLISKEGEVFSLKSNRVLTNYTNNKGYKFTSFYIEGKQHWYLLHRVLAFVYLDLPSLSSELEVDHIDDNKLNNSLDNLQVLTREKHLAKTIARRSCRKSCSVCKINKLKSSNITGKCAKCLQKEKPEITLQDIVEAVLSSNWSAAGRSLGYSDNGLRKKYKQLSNGLDPKNIKIDFKLT